ncbi:hypothetical protein TNCV_3004631 [Trichonephila clavipes]|nr:hypothetical protein TNCV_3004631 [Trichonephila clavipes]
MRTQSDVQSHLDIRVTEQIPTGDESLAKVKGLRSRKIIRDDRGDTMGIERAAVAQWLSEGILKSHSLSSLLNFLRAFGDGPVAGVPGGQGIGSWLACLEFEPSSTKDPPSRAAMHVKSIES